MQNHFVENTVLSKDEIRALFLEKRNAMGKDEVAKKSEAIMNRLFSMNEYRNAKTVAFYVSFGSEVETWSMIERALEEGKRTCVPVCRGTKMVFSRVRSTGEIDSKSEFGIMEPGRIDELPLGEIDLFALPCKAFDAQRHRIGFGVGHHDRALVNAGGKKVCLAFEAQKAENIPAEPHDIRMDFIVTENKVYCQK